MMVPFDTKSLMNITTKYLMWGGFYHGATAGFYHVAERFYPARLAFFTFQGVLESAHMGQHDDYGKLILRQAAGRCCKNGETCTTSYGDSWAHIDGTVGSSIAVEIESRTGKQVRGAILDLILHAYPKKLLILVPMYIGRHQVKESEFILKRFVE